MSKMKNCLARLLVLCILLGTEACATNKPGNSQSSAGVSAAASGQIGTASTTPLDSSKYLGNMLPYPYEKTNFTAAPKGYHPVFIQYVGRHGSRNICRPSYDKTLYELLSAAEKDKEITPAGTELKNQIEELMQFEKGRYGQLTKLGRENLNKLGERTAEDYIEIFNDGKPILGYATNVKRTQDSRDEFFSGFKKIASKNQITTSFYPEQEDPYLRPFDIDAKYIDYKNNGAWKKIVEKYTSGTTGESHNKQILTRFFSIKFYDRLKNGEFQLKDSDGATILKNPSDAAENLFNLYMHTANLAGEGADFNFKKYFTSDEIAWYAGVFNIDVFYKYGPSMESNNVMAPMSAPLVKYMIVSSDEALKNKNYAGIFSFAHDNTIAPLAAFLEIKGGCESTNDPGEVANLWSAAKIMPMCSNIQWVFYTNGKNYLVKMLFNEEETAFPVETDSYPYYNWDDVEAYYGNKAEALGISLNSTLKDNIKTLKGSDHNGSK
ncbi:histidine phosphatase family protein [Caproicibacter fermentans]|uniref:Multiple inositol polyphosphate phosphatase 1 n=1 Tax=Caproicibacter fermentans TaxID=2576756 RepID=A0A7G8TDR4_9FIRM|nr:histidine phosphatase family protein [Caproicibacter fermentans]QNK41755.1 histidine-type phosphatase [Caproicibacter fermentans]